ncbi:MAG: hypothetical protein B7Z37_20470 [Verrucomicrobia bacterium 12-59-8]|nr:MAG: hypothetical protein B7Z37_20470 [Verrucomicrobia bacterium 12-59-8]
MSFLRHLCLPLLLGLSSCTYLENKFGGMMPSLSKKGAEDKRIGEAKVIGVIEMVNPEQNYVLINCEQRVDIPAGTEIISQGVNGSDAKLKVTPERKGNYITADITQGVPQVRDLVVYQVQRADAPAPTVTTATGAVVPLTPVMQADVIPPLDAPFQQMAPVQPTMRPSAEPPIPQLRQMPPAPAPPTADEPAADLSKLPPVIR